MPLPLPPDPTAPIPKWYWNEWSPRGTLDAQKPEEISFRVTNPRWTPNADGVTNDLTVEFQLQFNPNITTGLPQLDGDPLVHVVLGIFLDGIRVSGENQYFTTITTHFEWDHAFPQLALDGEKRYAIRVAIPYDTYLDPAEPTDPLWHAEHLLQSRPLSHHAHAGDGGIWQAFTSVR